jgi:hypothetical protein
MPGTPWVGFLRCVYKQKDPNELDQALGPIRSRIEGRFAKGIPPAGTPKGFNLRALMTGMPFLIKGKAFKKSTPSPFFTADGQTPVATPHILSKDELQAARALAGF